MPHAWQKVLTRPGIPRVVEYHSRSYPHLAQSVSRACRYTVSRPPTTMADKIADAVENGRQEVYKNKSKQIKSFKITSNNLNKIW